MVVWFRSNSSVSIFTIRYYRINLFPLFRDIKASNLLLSHNGILKVGDFGLAREYGSPLKAYTSVVVTLWYRAPELLLGIKEYSTFIDVWSVGCIFGELLQMKPLFTGKSDPDQLSLIYKLMGEFNTYRKERFFVNLNSRDLKSGNI